MRNKSLGEEETGRKKQVHQNNICSVDLFISIF